MAKVCLYVILALVKPYWPESAFVDKFCLTYLSIKQSKIPLKVILLHICIHVCLLPSLQLS